MPHGRRASLLWFPGFTRAWRRSRVHGSAPECTRVHARMDEIWMKCGGESLLRGWRLGTLARGPTAPAAAHHDPGTPVGGMTRRRRAGRATRIGGRRAARWGSIEPARTWARGRIVNDFSADVSTRTESWRGPGAPVLAHGSQRSTLPLTRKANFPSPLDHAPRTNVLIPGETSVHGCEPSRK